MNFKIKGLKIKNSYGVVRKFIGVHINSLSFTIVTFPPLKTLNWAMVLHALPLLGRQLRKCVSFY